MFNPGYPHQQAPYLPPVSNIPSRPTPRRGLSARWAQILVLSGTLVTIFMLTAVISLFLGDGNNNQAPVIISQTQSPDQEDEEISTPAEEPTNVLNEQEKFVGDGSSTVFELSQTPKSDDATELEVLVDGLKAKFDLDGQTITFNSPPSDGVDIVISYIGAEEVEEDITDSGEEPELSSEEPLRPEPIVLPITTEPTLTPIHPHTIIIPPDPEPIVEPETIIDPEDDIDLQYPLIAQEVKDLANELQLTSRAKRTLYEHNPKIFEDPGDANYSCGSGDANVIIYGCWIVDENDKSIQLIRSPSMQTTLAHELLHAIYYDALRRAETDDLHALLDQVQEQYPNEITEILEFYKQHYDNGDEDNAQFLKYSELHSFIGSQFYDLPDELEAHYARHFKDRRRVLAFYDTWHASSETKREENSQLQVAYDKQVEEWEECVRAALLSRQECLFYRPESQSYKDYNACLNSYRTLMSECLEIKPPVREYTAAG